MRTITVKGTGNVELAGCGAQEPLIVAATKRVDA